MVSLKKYYNLAANSILESVISLCIISVCLYVAVLVFAAVFSPRTSAHFFNTQNKINELFFLAQLKKDSLQNENKNEHFAIEETPVNQGLSKILIHYKDSANYQSDQIFYVQSEE